VIPDARGLSPDLFTSYDWDERRNSLALRCGVDPVAIVKYRIELAGL
jgi:hypothetical protein